MPNGMMIMVFGLTGRLSGMRRIVDHDNVLIGLLGIHLCRHQTTVQSS